MNKMLFGRTLSLRAVAAALLLSATQAGCPILDPIFVTDGDDGTFTQIPASIRWVGNPPTSLEAGETWEAQIQILDAAGDPLRQGDFWGGINLIVSVERPDQTIDEYGINTDGIELVDIQIGDFYQNGIHQLSLSSSNYSLSPPPQVLVDVAFSAPAYVLIDDIYLADLVACQVWPSFEVYVIDEFENIVTTAQDQITLYTSADGLTGTLTKSTINGVATFDDIMLLTESSFRLHVQSDTLGLPDRTGDSGVYFDIPLGPETRYGFSIAPNPTAQSGYPLSAFQLMAMDDCGNVPDPDTQRTLAVSLDSGNIGLFGGTFSQSGRWPVFNDLVYSGLGEIELSIGDGVLQDAVAAISVEAGPVTDSPLVRTSVDSEGDALTGEFQLLDLSPDGRFLLLRQGTPGSNGNLYLYDRTSDSSESIPCTGTCSGASLSADGRYVAFIPADTGVNAKLELYDRLLGDLHPKYWGGMQAARHVRLSRDGQWALRYLPCGGTNCSLYLTEIFTSGSVPIEWRAADSPWVAISERVSLSSNRLYTPLTSPSLMTVSDPDNLWDVFVRKLTGPASTPNINFTTYISIADDGTPSDNTASGAFISGNGRHVVFEADSTNLVPGDDNGVKDIFVRDRDVDDDGAFDEAGQSVLSLLSQSEAGDLGDAASHSASVSDDGRFVVFVSSATNLVPGVTSGVETVYVRDRDVSGDGEFDESGDVALEVVVIASDGTTVRPGATPLISGDGRFIAFVSSATDLISGDSSGVGGVFLAPNPLYP